MSFVEIADVALRYAPQGGAEGTLAVDGLPGSAFVGAADAAPAS